MPRKTRQKSSVALVRALRLKRSLRDAAHEVQWIVDELRYRLGAGADVVELTETELGVLHVAFDQLDDDLADVAKCVERHDDPRQSRLVETLDRAAQVRVDLEPMRLTQEQRDGIACLKCGRPWGAMLPAGWLLGRQVFEHENCADVRGLNGGSVCVSCGGNHEHATLCPERAS